MCMADYRISRFVIAVPFNAPGVQSGGVVLPPNKQRVGATFFCPLSGGGASIQIGDPNNTVCEFGFDLAQQVTHFCFATHGNLTQLGFYGGSTVGGTTIEGIEYILPEGVLNSQLKDY